MSRAGVARHRRAAAAASVAVAHLAAFEEHGFRWGGDFLTPDNHHLEWVGATG